MTPLRIVLIGCVESTEVALKTLLSLNDRRVSVAGLITRRASRFNTDFVDLMPLAAGAGIPVLAVDNAESDAEQLDWLRARAPDLILVVGWSRLIGREALSIPTHGTIGYHPAALPANRGRHPIVWALALGLEQTASSFFLMGEGTDDGPVVSQQPVAILADDDARTLYDKLLAVIPVQVADIVAQLKAGAIHGRAQDHQNANSWRKRSAADGRIDWRMSARSIYNLVRALTRPYPGAHFDFGGQEIKVWKCRVEDCAAANIEPGKVLCRDADTLLVKAGDAAIRILEADLAAYPETGDYL